MQINILSNIGNYKSVYQSFYRDYGVKLASNRRMFLSSSPLILPGVGEFDSYIEAVKNMELESCLRERHRSGLITIGICMGAQILLESSEESRSKTSGLGIISGSVKRFKNQEIHTAWARTEKVSGEYLGTFYFNHGYYMESDDDSRVATIFKGGKDIDVVIKNSSTYGLQFHPEKSQSHGKEIISKILKGEI